MRKLPPRLAGRDLFLLSLASVLQAASKLDQGAAFSGKSEVLLHPPVPAERDADQ